MAVSFGPLALFYIAGTYHLTEAVQSTAAEVEDGSASAVSIGPKGSTTSSSTNVFAVEESHDDDLLVVCIERSGMVWYWGFICCFVW